MVKSYICSICMHKVEAGRQYIDIGRKIAKTLHSKSSGYNSEPGRHYALEYDVLKRSADVFVEAGVSANTITAVGAVLGAIGTALLTKPSQFADKIEQITVGKIKPSVGVVKSAGAIAFALSCFGDLQDGAVAKRSQNGETKFGKVFDGFVNKIIDTTPALCMQVWPESQREALAGSLYTILAPLSTMIRSIALEHDVPIPKTGVGSRVGTVATLSVGYTVERWRGRANGWLGGILTAQRLVDIGIRYRTVIRSGDEEAIQQVNKDITEYFGLVLIGKALSDNPLLPFGLEMAKLLDVKVGEAYGERLHEKIRNRLPSLFSDASLDETISP